MVVHAIKTMIGHLCLDRSYTGRQENTSDTLITAVLACEYIKKSDYE